MRSLAGDKMAVREDLPTWQIRYTGGVFSLCAFLLLAAAAAPGARFSGIWTGHMADRNGDLQDFSFRFEQRDEMLTGKMYGDNESTPITDGKVSGDTITFLVTTELNGSVTKTLYTGTLNGAGIQMKRERLGAKPDPAKPEGAKHDKPQPKQTFMLKQL